MDFWDFVKGGVHENETKEQAIKREIFEETGMESFDSIEEIQSNLPLQPDIEEFAKTVERGENINAGNSFRSFLSTLGQLLLSFKEMVQEGFCSSHD